MICIFFLKFSCTPQPHCKGVFRFGVVRYSDIEGQRPYKLHRSCCKVIYFPFCFISLNAPHRGFFWKGVECPTIPNTWLLQYGCQHRLRSLIDFTFSCDNLDFKFPFMFVLVSPMLLACWGCKMWASKSFPVLALKCGLYSKRPVYTWTESENS